ncbi:drug transporter domain protein [Mycobacterium ulcerans str. Harvey]|uniref:Drug transporter domain protein n=1 Tax=Mycobacterium ulcerans str. Harvey TaxID=1299332 RepID=A0ABN0QRH1_MYCUL|nr:drug transporter domain protein [Mycobacterium ulcerans str. Harvey]
MLGCAFATVAVALAWLSFEMVPDTSISHLIMPTIVLGLGLAFIRPAPTATATRKLAPQLAGAGSGVYNTAGSLGQLLGSASMAAFIASRTAAEMPTPSDSAQLSALREAEKTVVQLVESLREPFAAVMSQSMLLLALIALIGMATAFFIADRTRFTGIDQRPASTSSSARAVDGSPCRLSVPSTKPTGPGSRSTGIRKLLDDRFAELGQRIRSREVGEPNVEPLDSLRGQAGKVFDHFSGAAADQPRPKVSESAGAHFTHAGRIFTATDKAHHLLNRYSG